MQVSISETSNLSALLSYVKYTFANLPDYPSPTSQETNATERLCQKAQFAIVLGNPVTVLVKIRQIHDSRKTNRRD
ncbi:hypothetical protein D0469_20595 [Peribacillus saganii]|uniref:Uncharacterized protein n=1 Tax=Peribacillus saganii TaxID=2303992 RepID=A0A372L9N2_9BACI|nr:hypothetical protein [Peribacillus saganii]RFU62304.1 hypothetical protein D0469_20595 [Peribacillus saganii]